MKPRIRRYATHDSVRLPAQHCVSTARVRLESARLRDLAYPGNGPDPDVEPVAAGDSRATPPAQSCPSQARRLRRSGCSHTDIIRPTMPIVVQKYGGSSVADVAQHPPGRRTRHAHDRPPGTTSSSSSRRWATRPTTCWRWPSRCRPNPDRRELDMLLTAGRAHLDGAALDGHPRAGRRRHQLHRQPVRHHHQRSPRRRAHHRGAAVPRPGRARARQDRRRSPAIRACPTDGSDDARPRRQRYDRRRDGGGARTPSTARSARTSTASTPPTRASSRRPGASARSPTRRRRRWPRRARKC